MIFWWLFWKLANWHTRKIMLQINQIQQDNAFMNYSYLYIYLTYFGGCIFSSFSWSVMAVTTSPWALNKSMNSSRISWTSQMNLMFQLVFWPQRTETSGLRLTNSLLKVNKVEVIAISFQQIHERKEFKTC